MLRGIHPLLSPDLLHALAAMGHGDRIAVVDANFPALSHAKRLIELPGVTAPAGTGGNSVSVADRRFRTPSRVGYASRRRCGNDSRGGA